MAGKNKIIVLGSSGFIGRSLCPFLQEHGLHIVRADRTGDVDESLDALDQQGIRIVLEKHQPDYVINLVGFTDESQPDLLYKLNVFPFINVAEGLIALNMRARVLLLSSAAEFGACMADGPLREEDHKNPISHYGTAKYMQSLLANIYHRHYKMDVVIARPFNIIGNEMSEKLVPACFVGEFIRQSGTNHPVELKTKQLSPVRDFLSVKDVVKAIYTIMIAGTAGESYNISSGTGLVIRDIINMIARVTETASYNVVEQPSNNNHGIIAYSIGDNSKLRDLGWSCSTTTERAIIDLVTTLKNISKGEHTTGFNNEEKV